MADMEAKAAASLLEDQGITSSTSSTSDNSATTLCLRARSTKRTSVSSIELAISSSASLMSTIFCSMLDWPEQNQTIPDICHGQRPSKNSVRYKIFKIERRKEAYLSILNIFLKVFLGVFHNLLVKHLESKNPVHIKEMKNIRYEPDVTKENISKPPPSKRQGEIAGSAALLDGQDCLPAPPMRRHKSHLLLCQNIFSMWLLSLKHLPACPLALESENSCRVNLARSPHSRPHPGLQHIQYKC